MLTHAQGDNDKETYYNVETSKVMKQHPYVNMQG